MTSVVPDVEETRGGCLGTGLRVLGVLVVLLLVLVLAGALYEAFAQRDVAEQFPPPGQVVAVNGRDMHINCRGEGSPTILLDAGQGGWSSDWVAFMPELSRSYRVCAYDRAGYGWSEPAADERAPQDAAADLAALLDAAEVQPPYVLVAFSHAGLAARIFAAQNVEQMAGLVLIDSATEFDNELMSPALRQQQQGVVGLFEGFGLLAQGGLLRLLGTENMAQSAPFIATDPADPAVYFTFIAAPQWWETSAKEFASHLNDAHLAQVRDLGPIQDIPLIIVGSDVLEADGGLDMARLQAARHEVLRELAAQSALGAFVVAEGSTHDIVGERPDVVREAIDAVAGR